MREPIIIFEDGTTDIFETLFEAERYLEPIDAKLGSDLIFDSEGKVLVATVSRNSKGVETTHINEKATTTKMDKDKLRKILIEFLTQLNYSNNELKKLQLNELVKKSVKYKTK